MKRVKHLFFMKIVKKQVGCMTKGQKGSLRVTNIQYRREDSNGMDRAFGLGECREAAQGKFQSHIG